MQIFTQIAQLPIWLLVALLLLVVSVIVIAILTGREIHFWPPSIGPSVKQGHFEDEIIRLQTQLSEEKNRYSVLQGETDRSQERLKNEIDMLHKKLMQKEAERDKLQERLDANLQPLGSDQSIGKLLALFDRQAMRVPLHIENPGAMFISLRNLRTDLQQSGISTLKNPLARELFEKIKSDLEFTERTINMLEMMDMKDLQSEEFPRGLSLGRLFNATYSFELRASLGFAGIPFDFDYYPDRFNHNRFRQVTHLIEYMVRRAWYKQGNKQITREDSKEIKQDEAIASFIMVWIFASIDRIRESVLSEVEVLRKVLEQDTAR